MPGSILSLNVVVLMPSVMIIVLTTNDYRVYAQGVTSHDYHIAGKFGG